MKLPDFAELGSFQRVGAPTPEPPTSVARVDNPAAAAQATEGLGQAAQTSGIDIKNVMDVADVNNAMANSFQPKLRDLAQGFYSLQGKAAVDAAAGTPDMPSYGQQVESAMQDTAANLTGSAQRMFMSQAQHQVENEFYRAAMHAGAQQVAYANQAHDAVQANDLKEAQTAFSGGDNATGQDAIKRMQIREVLHQQSLGNAPDSDITQAKLNNLNTASAVNIFDNLSPAQQKAWGDAHFPNGTSSGAAPNIGADTVKPYTEQQIADIRTKVSQPSPYDALFQSIGQKYGIAPQELKLHAVAESGLNPKADNGQAQGLMQLSNGNIKALGITDPLDPAQSIDGAARLMQQNGAKDTHTADLMYYGGTDTAQQGPNSQQYAANLAAVRGGAHAVEDVVPQSTSKPDVMGVPIPPATALKLAQAGNANYQHAQNMQKIEYDKQVESFAADPHFTSMLQVPDNIKAGFANEPKMQDYLAARASYNLKNSENIVDADTQQYGSGFYNILQNVYSPNGVSKPSDLYQYMGQGGILTVPGFDALKGEMAQKSTPDGQAVAEAKARLFDMGANAIYGQARSYGVQDPKGEELHQRWLALTLNDYNQGIKAGKSPAQLLNPESPDYVGKTVAMFTRSDTQMLKDSLKVPPRTLDSLSSDIQYGRMTQAQAQTEAPTLIRQQYASGKMTKEQAHNEAIRFGLLRNAPAPIPEVPRPE